jgi:O-antigen/teichoic acid export membrane protein
VTRRAAALAGPLRKVALFSAPPLLASVAPLLALSAIARTNGTDAWVALLLGQAIGAIAALIITWGWDIGGPARAASAPDPAQRALLRLSAAARLRIAIVVLAAALAVSVLLVPGAGMVVAALAALAGGVQGLSLNWWFVATGRPGGIVLTDALPRSATAVLAAVLIFAGLPPWIYPLALLAALLVSYTFAYRRWLGGTASPTRQEIRESVRADRRLAAIAITTSAYTTGTLPLVQWVAPLAAAAFGSAQRVTSYWSFSITVLGNAAQNWVNRHGIAEVGRRARSALVAFAVLGVVLGAALALLGPMVAKLVFGDDLAVPAPVYPAFAVVFLSVSLSTVIGRLYLVPLGQERAVARVTLFVAAFGVAALVAGAAGWGAVGAATAMAATEALATLLLAGAALRTRASLRRGVAHGAAPTPVRA